MKTNLYYIYKIHFPQLTKQNFYVQLLSIHAPRAQTKKYFTPFKFN